MLVLSLCVETAPTCHSSTSSIMPTFVVLYSVIDLSVGIHNRLGMLVPLDSSRDLATGTGHSTSRWTIVGRMALDFVATSHLFLS